MLAVVEGHSSSPEGLEDGYDYGFVVTFATAQARDAYISTTRVTARSPTRSAQPPSGSSSSISDPAGLIATAKGKPRSTVALTECYRNSPETHSSDCVRTLTGHDASACDDLQRDQP